MRKLDLNTLVPSRTRGDGEGTEQEHENHYVPHIGKSQ